MPIREAVRRLDAAGLVENTPHRGARVTELSVTDLAEVYEARLALEVLAIRRAAERFGAAEEAIARRRLDELNACSDDNSAATSAAHAAFHFALYRAADSAWLERLVRPVWETAERYRLEVPQCRQLATRAGEHEAIHAACVARAPDGAAEHGADLGEQPLPGRRQPHAARKPLEQRPAQLLLERADLLGERRLRDEHALGRTGDVALLGDDREVLELTEVHAISTAYASANEAVLDL